MRFHLLAAVLFLTLLTAAPLTASPAGITWHSDGKALTVSTGAYALRLDAATGAPQKLILNGRQAVTFGPAGWWRLTLDNGQIIGAGDCVTTVTRTADHLRCRYVATAATVLLTVAFEPQSITLQAQVMSASAALTRIALPSTLGFSPALLNHAYVPVEIGHSLEPSFFERQPASNAARYSAVSLRRTFPGSGRRAGAGL